MGKKKRQKKVPQAQHKTVGEKKTELKEEELLTERVAQLDVARNDSSLAIKEEKPQEKVQTVRKRSEQIADKTEPVDAQAKSTGSKVDSSPLKDSSLAIKEEKPQEKVQTVRKRSEQIADKTETVDAQAKSTESKTDSSPLPSSQGSKANDAEKKILIQGAGGSCGRTAKKLEPPNSANRRKQVGTVGRQIMVQANHFEMKINVPKGTVYHYDLQFKFPWKREVRKSDKPFLILVIEKLKEKYKDIFGNPLSVVHDGFKNLYTCRLLNMPSGVFEGSVSLKESVDSDREIVVKTQVKYCGSVAVQDAVNEFLQRGKTATKPADAVQMLNIILGMTPQLLYVTLGRNYFNPVQDKSCVVDLGGGKSLWVGTFQSVRLGWKPFVNIDMANKPAYEEQMVMEFVAKLITRPQYQGRGGPGQQTRPGSNQVTEIRDKRDFHKVDDELKQLKVKYLRPDGQKREYRINKLMDPPVHLKMKLDNGKIITIDKYFKDQYKCNLKYPKLPCLHVGDPKKTIYIPMEFCLLKRQVAPRSKVLNDREAAAMIKVTAVPPAERKKRIIQNLKSMNQGFQRDEYAKAFGLSVLQEMVSIPGYVLPHPSLKYKKQGKECEFKLGREGGKWNMGTPRDREKYMFIGAKSLDHWGVLDLAQLNDNEISGFIDALYTEGISRGLNIEHPTYEKADERKLSDVEQKFKQLYNNIKLNGHDPQLIMVFVPYKGRIRSSIKFLGDCQLKIPTQFILKENVIGRARQGPPPGPSQQTLHNLCLKINSKLRGVNQALFKRPDLMNKPVMLMGADVTHPAPGDLKLGKKPSIAAIVGSTDPNASKYYCEVRLQYEGQVVEIIQQMEEVTKSLLKKFQRDAGQRLPLSIIYYRDGVSEGQFLEVLNCELSAIRRACSSFGDSYKPKITFLVAQKRHKTRLFPKDSRKDGVGKMENVPPGTVVDSIITHPTEYDFFLASHEGIKGTTKPTHYHLLWDDNNLSPNELQLLTYHLCHLYSRCERSVSYPAPTYYAHLAAFRAREHHNALLEKYEGKEIPKENIRQIERPELINFFV